MNDWFTLEEIASEMCKQVHDFAKHELIEGTPFYYLQQGLLKATLRYEKAKNKSKPIDPGEKPDYLPKTCRKHGALEPEYIRIYMYKWEWTAFCLHCKRIQWKRKNEKDKEKRKKFNPPAIKEIGKIVNKLGKVKDEDFSSN